MTTDVVAILDAGLSQVLVTARPIKATVKEEAKQPEHPLETGATVSDHRIILPVSIELSVVLAGDSYRQTYQEARELFLKGDLLTVQTTAASYPNMCIGSMPHEESPDVADGANLALTLCEVQFVAAQFAQLNVKHKNDGKTVKRGEQQPKESAKQSSILSGLFK